MLPFAQSEAFWSVTLGKRQVLLKGGLLSQGSEVRQALRHGILEFLIVDSASSAGNFSNSQIIF